MIKTANSINSPMQSAGVFGQQHKLSLQLLRIFRISNLSESVWSGDTFSQRYLMYVTEGNAENMPKLRRNKSHKTQKCSIEFPHLEDINVISRALSNATIGSMK